MPIYEFECKSCSQRFEVLVATNSVPVKTCIYCNSKEIEKVPSLSSFQFKGSGWYITDYGSSRQAKEPSKAGQEKAAIKENSTGSKNVG